MREVFPDMPQSLILEDLKVTRSVELTIDNIVDGRVVVPSVSIVYCNKIFAFT